MGRLRSTQGDVRGPAAAWSSFSVQLPGAAADVEHVPRAAGRDRGPGALHDQVEGRAARSTVADGPVSRLVNLLDVRVEATADLLDGGSFFWLIQPSTEADTLSEGSVPAR